VSIHNLQELKKHKALIRTARITNNSTQKATTEVIHCLNLMLGIPFVVYSIKQELNYHLDNFINRCCSSDLIKQESCFIKPEDVMEKISWNKPEDVMEKISWNVVVSFLHYYAASYPKTATTSVSPWHKP
jgi:hypothetical protein